MHTRPSVPRPLLIVPILLLILAAAYLYTRGGNTLGVLPIDRATLSGSGTIQGDEYTVASQVAGRIVALKADEGDTVRAGQALAELDATLPASQLEQADAALAAAQANLDKTRSGTRPEEVRNAQAALAQAVARRDSARVALADAQATRSATQDLQARIDLAHATLDATEHRAAAANLLAQAASKERDYYQRTLADVENGVTIDMQTPQGRIVRTFNVRTEDLRTQLALAAAKEWSAWSAQGAAFAQRDAARSDLQNLLAQQNDPLVLKAQVDAAQSQLDAAEAAVKLAQARVDAVKADPRSELVAAAQAQVTQAQAARDSLATQLTKMTLAAPSAGSVNQRLLNLGEMAAPGAAVFHIANLDAVTLTIYIPENRIGSVRVGAPALVSADAYPGRAFAGTVSYISPQAEFTPKNIATQDQRSTQVFAVKVRIENADHALKSGMPADAILQ